MLFNTKLSSWQQNGVNAKGQTLILIMTEKFWEFILQSCIVVLEFILSNDKVVLNEFLFCKYIK